MAHNQAKFCREAHLGCLSSASWLQSRRGRANLCGEALLGSLSSASQTVRFADSSLCGTVRDTLQLSSYHQPPSQGPSVERQIVGSGFSGRSTGCRSRTMSDGSRIQINLPAQRGRPDTKLHGRCIRFLEHHDRKITIFADPGEELADALGRACVDMIAFCITR